MPNSVGHHWLLLRGLCRETAHWGSFPDLLQLSYPEATISSIDLPGTGRYYQGQSPDSIEAITAEVRDQALAAGLLAQPVTVLALSMGAMVAWEWLQRHPQEIAAAALVNTSFAGLSPFYRRMRWQSYRQFLGLLLERDLYKRELAIIKLVSNREDHYLETAKAWTAIQQIRPISLSNCLNQLKAAAQYVPVNRKPEAGLLILNGRGDRLVAPVCSEAIHHKWQIDISKHTWAGHDLCLDDGAWVANRLKHWTNQLSF
jgi:pimeloyl-ACP methyl ester carboxylesterase